MSTLYDDWLLGVLVKHGDKRVRTVDRINGWEFTQKAMSHGHMETVTDDEGRETGYWLTPMATKYLEKQNGKN